MSVKAVMQLHEFSNLAVQIYSNTIVNFKNIKMEYIKFVINGGLSTNICRREVGDLTDVENSSFAVEIT